MNMEKFYNRLGLSVMVVGMLFLTVACLSSRAEAGDLKIDAISSVVKFQNGPELCSGVAIEVPPLKDESVVVPTIILTAKHCVGVDHGMIIDESTKGNTYQRVLLPYKVLVVSKTVDLAAIIVDEPLVKAHVAKELLVDEGQDVWAVGYPLGMSRTVTKGLMNSREVVQGPNGDFQSFYRASASVNQGSSGGGLFQKNGDQYELIGITSMKVNGSDFMNYFVPLDEILNFLSKGE